MASDGSVLRSHDSSSEFAIQQNDGTVRVARSRPAENFELEDVNALNASPVTGWIPVPFPYQTNATRISLTVSAAAGNKSYPQRKP